MDIHVNYLAVLVAAIVSYLVATLWYALLFGKAWQKFTGITGTKPAPATILLSLVGAFVMSLVLYHLILFSNAFLHMGGIVGGLFGGFHGWLGFIAPATLMTKLYEKKPWGLWLLDNAFWLVSLLIMGIILSLWM